MTAVPTARSYSLEQLAELLGAELVGVASTPITGVAGIESATASDLTFIANPRYASQAAITRAGAILVTPDFPALTTPTLRLKDPYLSFARVIELFHRRPHYPAGIHPTAVIDPSVQLGPGAHIGAYVVVMEGVTLGSEAVLLPHAVIYPEVRAGNRLWLHAHAVVREHCVLGDDVTLQSGAIVGADGFGFARQPDNRWHKIPQSGHVVIEDGVEIQANACVDRASVGVTRIGSGSKIDNLVQVGHGSTVGRDTLLCAQVGLAGSSHIGNRVILAGQVGVAGHCTVGDGATATAQSGVPGDVAPGTIVSGYPAIENRRWLKNVAALNRLPDLLRNLQRERK